MGLVDQLVKPLGMLICLSYRKQYLFPYPLAFKTVILKYYPVPFNFIVSFCYANMQRKVTKRGLNQVISRFFFFNQPKCGFYVTISISTLAVVNFQAYYHSVIWSFWSPCLWQLLIGNNNYRVCVTTCKILIFFKRRWMRMKWAVHFGIRPKYFFLGGGGACFTETVDNLVLSTELIL